MAFTATWARRCVRAPRYDRTGDVVHRALVIALSIPILVSVVSADDNRLANQREKRDEQSS